MSKPVSLNGIITVSYTHLDVYKRQIEGCEHAVFEILSNSIDEAREGYGKEITVTRFLDGSVEAVGGEGSPVEATVSGIFTNVKAQDSIGVAPSYDLYDNIVFTDTATASALLYGSKSETGFQYGDFYVDDPEELDRIMDDVRSIAGMDWESCTLTRCV